MEERRLHKKMKYICNKTDKYCRFHCYEQIKSKIYVFCKNKEECKNKGITMLVKKK